MFTSQHGQPAPVSGELTPTRGSAYTQLSRGVVDPSILLIGRGRCIGFQEVGAVTCLLVPTFQNGMSEPGNNALKADESERLLASDYITIDLLRTSSARRRV